MSEHLNVYFKTYFGTKDEDAQASDEDGGARSGVQLLAPRNGENLRSPYHVQKKRQSSYSPIISAEPRVWKLHKQMMQCPKSMFGAMAEIECQLNVGFR